MVYPERYNKVSLSLSLSLSLFDAQFVFSFVFNKINRKISWGWCKGIESCKFEFEHFRMLKNLGASMLFLVYSLLNPLVRNIECVELFCISKIILWSLYSLLFLMLMCFWPLLEFL
jgi:hypothetical protein